MDPWAGDNDPRALTVRAHGRFCRSPKWRVRGTIFRTRRFVNARCHPPRAGRTRAGVDSGSRHLIPCPQLFVDSGCAALIYEPPSKAEGTARIDRFEKSPNLAVSSVPVELVQDAGIQAPRHGLRAQLHGAKDSKVVAGVEPSAGRNG